MNKNKSRTRIRFLATAGIIAALYAALTVAFPFLPFLAFGPIQLRISEVLTVLPVYTPAAIPGLFIGALLANTIGVQMGLTYGLDILFGSMASLTAALLTYYFRRIKTKNLSLVSTIPPVIVNAIVIGAMIAYFFVPEAPNGRFILFLTYASQIAVGQFIVCCLGGTALMTGLNRHENRLFGPDSF